MTAQPPQAGVYLRAYLAPLAAFLERADVTDIYVNRPGEIWVETLGGASERHDAPELSETALERLARQVAALTHQGISRAHPLLSAALPDGARFQAIAPPATRGGMAIAIRKHVSADLGLDDYAAAGAFDETRRGGALHGDQGIAELAALLEAGNLAAMLRQAVRSRRNILVSGGTSTGKTTFLNALLREIAPDERLIVIEDTPELHLRHANAIGLLATRGELGEARVTADDLLGASLRMRPDRIILGELRGEEAYAFLRAINTGHPGSLSSVHANSAAAAVEQIALLILQRGTRLSREDVTHYVRSTIDVFVQLERVGGRRRVAEVLLPGASGL